MVFRIKKGAMIRCDLRYRTRNFQSFVKFETFAKFFEILRAAWDARNSVRYHRVNVSTMSTYL